MANDPTFNYLKLLADWFPSWLLLAIGLVLWIALNPAVLRKIRENVSGAKFGSFEIQLRELKEQVVQAQAQVQDLTEANRQLSEIVAGIDPDAPAEQIAGARQALKAIAGDIDNLDEIYADLDEGTPPERFYAATEILRKRRAVEGFDRLIAAVDRIAANPDLEGLRLKFIWTLADAVRVTVLSAVKYSPMPRLTREQLLGAQTALEKLNDHPKVAADRPDDPKKGVRGPTRYALVWIGKGLENYESAER
jgi:hypothetical protein